MTRICIVELSVKAKPVALGLPSSPHCFVVASPVQHVDARSAVPASATTKEYQPDNSVSYPPSRQGSDSIKL